MEYRLSEIARITGGRLCGEDRHIRLVSTDSRTVTDAGGTVFVALRGPNRDGHVYLAELYKTGVRAFIIGQDADLSGLAGATGAGMVKVPDTLAALQAWAHHHRQRFPEMTVVAVTGSNGKTIVKEWFAQLWDSAEPFFRSPKSYNSQIGVPLSLLMMKGDEKLALIEAGMSQKNEMERLGRIIAPRIGIITNIGQAHQENFHSTEEKLGEKLKLFARADTILYNADQPLVAEKIRERFNDKRLFSWGRRSGADVQVVETIEKDHSRRIKIAFNGKYYVFEIPFADEASFENIMHVVSLRLLLGMDIPVEKTVVLQPVAMRLELKKGINGCTIVNDAYNSDLHSLSIALDYLGSVAGRQPKALILSDILQSGMDAGELYEKVARLVREKGVEKLIGIGEQISRYSGLFQPGSQFFKDTGEFLSRFERSSFRGQAVLIKGSRRFRFERIGRVLEEKIHTTTLETDLDAMIHNLNFYRGRLKPGVKVMAMVKAMSYGHGTHEIASTLQHQRVDYLAVAFADEGVSLRENGITMPIVVLNPDPVSFALMIEHRLEPEIYNFPSLDAFLKEAKKYGEIRYPIHIKIDTGMHRLGFDSQDTDRLCDILAAETSVSVASVFSHLASCDMPGEDAFTEQQIARFEQASQKIAASLPGQKILRHIANTAAMDRFPETQFDMVRLGIGLYGISPFHRQELRTVASLKSIIVQIKEIPATETVGYCRKGLLKRDSRIAVIPIGYADGLDRRLSNGNWSVMVNGMPAPVVGNISMDTCMIDITGIDAAVGDVAVIFGDHPTVVQMAEALGTIPYEIFTGISMRVNRVFLKE